MITTTLHLGQMPGRARRVVACARRHHGLTLASWRPARAAAPAFGGFRATRVDSAGYSGAVDAGELSICTTTNPMTKRAARHLGPRTT